MFGYGGIWHAPVDDPVDMTAPESRIYASPPLNAPPRDPDHTDRVLAAARLAKDLYPGPAGEMIHAELKALAEFRYRFDKTCIGMRVVEQILGAARDRAT